MADASIQPTGYLTGTLEELVKALGDREGIITLITEEVCVLPNTKLDDLKKVVFLPDERVFDEKDKPKVCLSQTDPRLPATTAEPVGEEGQPETVNVYVWVIREEKPPVDPTKEPEDPGEMNIIVGTENYAPGLWSNLEPSFMLSGIPEGTQGYSYAAIAYDERFIPLSGNTYVSRDEGMYTLRFAILDPVGDVVSLSARYELMLDFTPPEYVQVNLTGTTTFEVLSEDALSGLDAYSVDAGVSWVPADPEGKPYQHAAAQGTKFPLGTILARDVAGNIAQYATDFEIPAPEPPISWGGGGGGGSEENKPNPHASDDDPDDAIYNTLALLEISQEPMHQLTIGEETLDLTLELDTAEGVDKSTLPEAVFTAELTRWASAIDAHEEQDSEETEEEPNTLVLTAQVGHFPGEYTYLWQFNGTVYRMLMNSGIEYLVLQVGENITAISTAGFTGGMEYTRLKAGGVSTRKFEYSVWTTSDALDPARMEMRMEVEVEEEVYPLTSDTAQPMYYYDVYTGPTEMMDVTFGQYQYNREEAEA